MNWHEKARDVTTYHKWMMSLLGYAHGRFQKEGWSIRKTAKHFKISPSTAADYIRIHNCSAEHPEILQIKEFRKARRYANACKKIGTEK